MVSKGQKRREKNYLAAHGGNNLLPPPPKLEELEALPSKLRKIMAFKNPSSLLTGPKMSKSKVDGNEKRKGGSFGEKLGEKHENSSIDGFKSKKSAKDVNEDVEPEANKERKRKRKRKEGKDLRFQELNLTAPLSKKKKRKEFLDAKKKNKIVEKQAIPEFPGHEKIKFGDVVEAPPKLSAPKAFKISLGTYQERRRLDAERVRTETIEAYRKHKGWSSRPGMRISAQEATSS